MRKDEDIGGYLLKKGCVMDRTIDMLINQFGREHLSI